MPERQSHRTEDLISNPSSEAKGSMQVPEGAKTVQKGSPKDWFPNVPHYPLPGEHACEQNKAVWRLDRSRCALLVHDMQAFWVERFDDAQLLIDNIAQLVSAARQHDIPIIYSLGEKVRNRAERGLALDLWGPGISTLEGVSDSDADIIPALKPMPSDYRVTKSKYSAFFQTDMEKILRSTGRTQLIVTGIFAHHGCLATALDAFMRNIQVFMLADATGDYTLEQHEMALAYVAETSGVISTASHALEQICSSNR